MRDHLHVVSVLLIVTTSMNSGGEADPGIIFYGPHGHRRTGIMTLIRLNRASDLVSFPRTGRPDPSSILQELCSKLTSDPEMNDVPLDPSVLIKLGCNQARHPPRGRRSNYLSNFARYLPRPGQSGDSKESSQKETVKVRFPPLTGRSDIPSNVGVIPEFSDHGSQQKRYKGPEMPLTGRSDIPSNVGVISEFSDHGSQQKRVRQGPITGRSDIPSNVGVIPEFSDHDESDAPLLFQFPQQNHVTGIRTYIRPNRASGLVSFPRTGRSGQESDSDVTLDFNKLEADAIRDGQWTKSQDQESQYQSKELEAMPEGEGTDKTSLEGMCRILQCHVNFLMI